MKYNTTAFGHHDLPLRWQDNQATSEARTHATGTFETRHHSVDSRGSSSVLRVTAFPQRQRGTRQRLPHLPEHRELLHPSDPVLFQSFFPCEHVHCWRVVSCVLLRKLLLLTHQCLTTLLFHF